MRILNQKLHHTQYVVEEYIKEPTKPQKSDPLFHWKSKQDSSPYLTGLAVHYLCAPLALQNDCLVWHLPNSNALTFVHVQPPQILIPRQNHRSIPMKF